MQRSRVTLAMIEAAAIDSDSPSPRMMARAGHGRSGGRIELELWPKERTALQASARALDETYAKVG